MKNEALRSDLRGFLVPSLCHAGDGQNRFRLQEIDRGENHCARPVVCCFVTRCYLATLIQLMGVAGVLAVAIPGRVEASSCGGPVHKNATDEEKLEFCIREVVIVGRVLEAKFRPSPIIHEEKTVQTDAGPRTFSSGRSTGSSTNLITVEVLEAFKGAAKKVLTFEYSDGGQFEVGGRYLIFLYDINGPLQTNRCLPNRKLDDDADLSHLRSLRVPHTAKTVCCDQRIVPWAGKDRHWNKRNPDPYGCSSAR